MLVARDDIATGRGRSSSAAGLKITEFVECPYCSGFWIALIWWGAFQLWPHGAIIVASAIAVTALLPLVERLTD